MAAIPRPVARPAVVPADRFPIGVVYSTTTKVAVMWDVNPHLRYSVDLWEGDDADELAAQVVNGILLLAGEAEKLGATIAVNVSHPGVAVAAASLAAGCPNRCIELINADRQVMRMRASLSDMRRAQYLLNQAAAARADLDGLAASIDPACVPRKPAVVCGTDASRSTRPGGPVAFGYVTTEGHYAARHVKHGSINIGEMRGVYMAVAAHPRRDMHILTDSQHTVAVLSGQRHPSNPAELALREKVWGATNKTGRILTVQWVPGHAGIPLNEAANRIAFNEYRRATLGVELDVSQHTAETIVAEYLPTLNQPLPEPSGRWCATIRDGQPLTDTEEVAA